MARDTVSIEKHTYAVSQIADLNSRDVRTAYVAVRRAGRVNGRVR